MIITLDGPSGSGKSTIAQMLAEKLGYFYLNSGYLYRALGYILVKHYGYSEEKLRNPDFADVEDCLLSGSFVYNYVCGRATVFFKADITDQLKQVEVSEYASLISRHAEVREILVEYQRNLAQAKRCMVVEGRDCGSKVFYDAAVKFFVTARAEVRAQRLQKDQAKLGNILSYAAADELVSRRDNRDATRKHAPLVQPAGCVLIDTSDHRPDEILDKMLAIITAASVSL